MENKPEETTTGLEILQGKIFSCLKGYPYFNFEIEEEEECEGGDNEKPPLIYMRYQRGQGYSE